MTKKHYNAIADAFIDTRAEHPESKEALEKLAMRLAHVLAQENALFHYGVFVSACNVEDSNE